MYWRVFLYFVSLFFSAVLLLTGYRILQKKKFTQKLQGGKAIAVGIIFCFLALFPLVYFLSTSRFFLEQFFGELWARLVKELVFFVIIFFGSFKALRQGILAIKEKETEIPFIDWVSTKRKGVSAVVWGIIFLLTSFVWFYFLLSQGRYWINFFFLSKDQTNGIAQEVVEQDKYLGWKTFISGESGFKLRHPWGFDVQTVGSDVLLTLNTICRNYEKIPGVEAKTYEVMEMGFVFRKKQGVNFHEISVEAHPQIWLRGIREDDGEVTIGGKNGYFFYRGEENIVRAKTYLIKLSETEAMEIDSSLLAEDPINWDCDDAIKPLRWDLHEKIISSIRFINEDISSGRVKSVVLKIPHYRSAEPGNILSKPIIREYFDKIIAVGEEFVANANALGFYESQNVGDIKLRLYAVKDDAVILEVIAEEKFDHKFHPRDPVEQIEVRDKTCIDGFPLVTDALYKYCFSLNKVEQRFELKYTIEEKSTLPTPLSK